MPSDLVLMPDRYGAPPPGLMAGFRPAESPTDPLGFATRLGALELDAILRRQPMIAPSGAPRLAGLRLTPDPVVLAELAGGDRDLAAHARQVIGERLLRAMGTASASRALLGGGARAPLLIDLPLAALRGLAEAKHPVPPLVLPPILAVLPLAAAADPAGLEAARRVLASRGWGLALSGLTAEALALTSPALLPGDLLLAPFSPDHSAEALRRVGPARLVLTGVDTPDAIALAIRLGIPRIAGRLPERLLTTARMAVCHYAAGCSAAACAERAAATGGHGRDGCADLPLLAAIAPG